jgi:hypothetical protein
MNIRICSKSRFFKGTMALILGCLSGLALFINYTKISRSLHSTIAPITQFAMAPLAHAMLDPLETTSAHTLYCLGAYKLSDLADKLYSENLSKQELTLVAYDLLQQRIDYWKKKMAACCWTNKKEIPVYIFLKPDITPEDMLAECRMVKKDSQNNRASGTTLHAYGKIPTVEIRQDYCQNPLLFFVTLLHELTHVEQCANADCLGKYNADLIPTIEEFPYLTNAIAFELYTSGIVSDNHLKTIATQVETEADTNGIIFFPNPCWIFKEFALKNKDMPEADNRVQHGYLSNKAFYEICWKRCQDYYMRYPSRLDQDQNILN